jgi:hypothetical protein
VPNCARNAGKDKPAWNWIRFIAMAISLWWVCLGQYAPYSRKNRVWLNNLSNQEYLWHRLKFQLTP